MLQEDEVLSLHGDDVVDHHDMEADHCVIISFAHDICRHMPTATKLQDVLR